MPYNHLKAVGLAFVAKLAEDHALAGEWMGTWQRPSFDDQSSSNISLMKN